MCSKSASHCASDSVFEQDKHQQPAELTGHFNLGQEPVWCRGALALAHQLRSGVRLAPGWEMHA